MTQAFSAWLEQSPPAANDSPHDAYWELRQQAWQALQHYGFPQLKTEAWKYTSLRSLERQAPQLVSTALSVAEADAMALLAAACPMALPENRIVFINGMFYPALSAGDAWQLSPADVPQAQHLLQSLGKAEDAFVRLALAHASQAWRLTLTRPLDATLTLFHLSSSNTEANAPAALNQLYLQVELTAGQHLALLEAFHGAPDQSAALYNYCLELNLAENASVQHGRQLSALAQTTQFARSEVYLQSHAEYYHADVLCAAAMARHEVRVHFIGPHAQAQLNSAARLGAKARLDQDWLMLHQADHCRTEQTFRAAVDDHSQASYTGRARIEQRIVGSIVHQSSRGLMLSNDAEVNARPVLEIYADEVQASHGATVGCLDEAALHYLCARGIDQTTARAMLIDAFVVSALADYPAGALKSELEKQLAQAGSESFE